MKKLLVTVFLVLSAVAGSAQACDASDGRWTNCPELPDEGNHDPLFDVIVNIDLRWLSKLSFVPTPSAVCSSPDAQRLAYAQSAASYIYANDIGDYHRRYMQLARIQYPDGTYEVYSFRVVPGTNYPDQTGVLEPAPRLQWVMEAEHAPYRCKR